MKIHIVEYQLCFGGDVKCEYCNGLSKITGIYAPQGEPIRGATVNCPKCVMWNRPMFSMGVVPKYTIKKKMVFGLEKELDAFIFRLHKIKMKLAFRYYGHRGGLPKFEYNNSLDCWEKARKQRHPYGERRPTEAGSVVSRRLTDEWTTSLTVNITHKTI